MAFVEDNKKAILAVIDAWKGKFSDELLVKKLQVELGLSKTPSRGTLPRHPEIKLAIDLKRKELRNKKLQAVEESKNLIESGGKLSDLMSKLKDDDSTISELIKLADRLEKENDKLQSENKRLITQNETLLERFARWQHNLQKMDGVDLNKLAANIDDGLPAKHR